MRSLSAALLAVQKTGNGTPYIKLVLTKSGSPSYLVETPTQTTAGELLSVDHIEQAWTGSATIIIDDTTGDWDDRNLRGYKAQFGYGYMAPAAEWSYSPPLYVFLDESVGEPGSRVKVLHCVDKWGLLQMLTVMSGAVRCTGTVGAGGYPAFVVGETVTHGGDTGVVLSQSQVGAAVHVVMFRMTAGAFNNGENLTSATGSLTNITVTAGGVGPSPGWEGAAALSVFNAVTTLLAGIATVTQDGADATTAYTPDLIFKLNQPTLAAVQEAAQVCMSLLRWDSNGDLRFIYLNPAPAADYSYSEGDHPMFTATKSNQVVEPERVVFVNQFPTYQTDYVYAGAAETASAGAMDGHKITMVYQDSKIASDAEAVNKATAAVRQAEQKSATGLVIVPHNCGQELLDWVTAVSPIVGPTISGRVQELRHQWRPGVYLLQIGLGGVAAAGLTQPFERALELINQWTGQTARQIDYWEAKMNQQLQAPEEPLYAGPQLGPYEALPEFQPADWGAMPTDNETLEQKMGVTARAWSVARSREEQVAKEKLEATLVPSVSVIYPPGSWEAEQEAKRLKSAAGFERTAQAIDRFVKAGEAFAARTNPLYRLGQRIKRRIGR